MKETDKQIHISEAEEFGISTQIQIAKRDEMEKFQDYLEVSKAEWEGMGTSIKSYRVLRLCEPITLD